MLHRLKDAVGWMFLFHPGWNNSFSLHSVFVCSTSDFYLGGINK